MSIIHKDVEISHEEYNASKYAHRILQSGKEYARITYVDGDIDPDQTYTDYYLKKHNLGKYASRGSSSSSSKSSKSSGIGLGTAVGVGAAVGAGIVGLAKKAFEESPEKKAEREQRIAEDNQINKIVDYKIEIFKKYIKQEYPKTGTTDELVERIKTLIEQAEEYKLEENHPDKLTAKLAEAKKEATAWLALKLCKQVKKQDPERAAQPDMKALRKKARRYSGLSSIIGVVLLCILLFLFIVIVGSI